MIWKEGSRNGNFKGIGRKISGEIASFHNTDVKQVHIIIVHLVVGDWITGGRVVAEPFRPPEISDSVGQVIGGGHGQYILMGLQLFLQNLKLRAQGMVVDPENQDVFFFVAGIFIVDEIQLSLHIYGQDDQDDCYQELACYQQVA